MVNPARVLNDKMACNHSSHWLKQVTGHLLASRGKEKYSHTLCRGGNNTQSVGEGPAGHLSRVANVYLPGGVPHTLTVGETETLFERGLCELIYEDLSGSFSILKRVE